MSLAWTLFYFSEIHNFLYLYVTDEQLFSFKCYSSVTFCPQGDWKCSKMYRTLTLQFISRKIWEFITEKGDISVLKF